MAEPKIRVSANSGSPWHSLASLDGRVLLNGLEFRLCVEASEPEGWADYVVTDGRGRVMRDGEEVRIRRSFGVVRIITAHRDEAARARSTSPTPRHSA